jgi:hypothetical protein
MSLRTAIACFCVIIAVVVTTGEVAVGQVHVCSNGVLSLVRQTLQGARFNASASNCVITIDGGTVSSISFEQPVTNLTLIIRQLDCRLSTTGGSCINFQNITGGSITIDGLKRHVEGTAASTRSIVAFQRFSMDIDFIHVAGVVVTCSIGANTDFVDIVLVRFSKTLSGRSLNVTNNTISGKVATKNNQQPHRPSSNAYFVQFGGAVSHFEVIEMSDNSFGGVGLEVSATSNAGVAHIALLCCGARCAALRPAPSSCATTSCAAHRAAPRPRLGSTRSTPTPR